MTDLKKKIRKSKKKCNKKKCKGKKGSCKWKKRNSFTIDGDYGDDYEY